MTASGKGRATRRKLIKVLAGAGLGAPIAANLAAQAKTTISPEILSKAEIVLGEKFSEERLRVINAALQRNLDQFQLVRDFEVDDLIEPAPIFSATGHY
jgi:hypothetical protein